MEQEEWDASSWCLQRAMEMLPLIAPHTLSLDDLEFVLKSVSGVAALAAASFLTSGHACAHNALAQVELGRGMIFSLITDTRMDVSSLREKHPRIYAAYKGLRKGASAILNPIQVVTLKEIQAAAEAVGITFKVSPDGEWRVEDSPGVQRPEGLQSMAIALPHPDTSWDGHTEDLTSDHRPESYLTALDTSQPLTAQQRTQVRSDLSVTQDVNGNIQVEFLPDSGSQSQTYLHDSHPGVATSIHHEFAIQLAKLETRIRHTEKFDDFTERRSLEYFKGIAKAGPIVSFNVTSLRSDAFIITKDTVMAIRFDPDVLGYEIVQEKAKLISGPESVLVERNDGPNGIQRNRMLSEVLKWLWSAAIKPVLSRLNLIQSRRGISAAALPRIWWVTSGVLGQFPFHAAGHRWHNSLENTMSHVVSSYVPTIRALEYSREKLACASASDPGKAVIVEMPETIGQNDLKLDDEIKAANQLSKRFSSCKVMSKPSKADVLRELEHCNLVHFGCHGVADPLHPRKSCLYVDGGKDKPPERITLEDLIQIDLANAQLAYLSACSTAQNKVAELNEEVLHIASVFQLIGFPQVIGTLWEAKDWAAKGVALAFYQRVTEEMEAGWHRTDKLALFLHEAIIQTREEGPTGKREARDNVLAWAPFVHMGC